MLRQRGLALGGSLDNAVVLGETGVLNPLRFDDEFVRHKMLDVIGDLALVGHAIAGHVSVQRGGHALHAELAQALLDQKDSWTLVGCRSAGGSACTGLRHGCRVTRDEPHTPYPLPQLLHPGVVIRGVSRFANDAAHPFVRSG